MSSGQTSPRTCRRTAIAVCVVLAVHAALLAWQGYRYSPTVDEPAHLAAGLNHWMFGRFELYRVNPPLVRMVAALPLLFFAPGIQQNEIESSAYGRPEFSAGSTLVSTGGFEFSRQLIWARWACVPFALIGGYFCFRFATELYDSRAGIAALILWSFCPNVLGNGALITPDVAAAALGVTATYFFWRWLFMPGWKTAFLSGLALGLALMTKLTWIILFVLWPVTALFWFTCARNSAGLLMPKGPPVAPRRVAAFHTGISISDSSDPAVRSSAPTNKPPLTYSFFQRMSLILRQSRMIQLALLLALGLYLLNLGYGFENSFEALGRFPFISKAFGGESAHEKPGNRSIGTWLESIPVPLPANYLRGIDVQTYDFEKRKWSYLRGEHKLGGWWYYYLYALSVKTPLGTLLLLALSMLPLGFRTLANIRTAPGSVHCTNTLVSAKISPPARRTALIVLPPAFAVLVLVSSQTGFSRYLRYILPALPFLYIWSSQLFSGLARANPLFYRSALSLLLISSVTSSICVFPHSLSYFNELAGGPINGPAHLLDANIDWGQDLFELKRWCQAHPDARPLHVEAAGVIDPAFATIQSRPFPRYRRAPDNPTQHIAPHYERKWFAISVNALYGYQHAGDRPHPYEWVHALTLVDHAGYAFYIYTTPDLATRSIPP